MTTEHQTMRQRVAAINCHPAQLEGEQRAAIEERIRRRLTGYPDRYVTEYANGDVDFALWLALVDLRLTRQIWLTHRDIADRPWREDYDAGRDPIDAADEAAEDEAGQLFD